MKRLFTTIQNIYKIDDLRIRILNTLGFLLIYRLGSFVVLPGVDSVVLEANAQQATGLAALINMFAGGAFSRASIFALGIMPYISASIVMQLMGIAVPQFAKMQKDGESGRKKITQWTRFLTIGICLAQAPSYIATSIDPRAIIENTPFFWITYHRDDVCDVVGRKNYGQGSWKRDFIVDYDWYNCQFSNCFSV